MDAKGEDWTRIPFGGGTKATDTLTKAGLADVILIGLAGHVVGVRAVMRQVANRLFPAAVAQLGQYGKRKASTWLLSPEAR